MKRFQFTPDIDEVIEQFYPLHGSKGVMKVVKEQYGVDIKKQSVVGRAKTLGVRFQGDTRELNERQMREHSRATQERDEWLDLISHMPATRS